MKRRREKREKKEKEMEAGLNDFHLITWL